MAVDIGCTVEGWSRLRNAEPLLLVTKPLSRVITAEGTAAPLRRPGLRWSPFGCHRPPANFPEPLMRVGHRPDARHAVPSQAAALLTSWAYDTKLQPIGNVTIPKLPPHWIPKRPLDDIRNEGSGEKMETQK